MLLGSLGFIRKDNQGLRRVTDAHVSTGEKWRSLAVKAYQKETITLSAGSLDRDPPETRDISSLTLSIDKERFDEIKEMMRQLRETVMKKVDEMGEVPRDRVCQLNMQLFPVTKLDASESRGAHHAK